MQNEREPVSSVNISEKDKKKDTGVNNVNVRGDEDSANIEVVSSLSQTSTADESSSSTSVSTKSASNKGTVHSSGKKKKRRRLHGHQLKEGSVYHVNIGLECEMPGMLLTSSIRIFSVFPILSPGEILWQIKPRSSM